MWCSGSPSRFTLTLRTVRTCEPSARSSATCSKRYNSQHGRGAVKTTEGIYQARGFRFALVVSRVNELIANRLLEGALDCLLRHGRHAAYGASRRRETLR